ncbi:hypothetical protein HHI36_013772 [Cryptolaemus montrouzieri]|uniref:Large ribosomal subunit protein mL46 n=1 Tax=Cryptolaemus montrouzieri TaxID=559131 RepID=A0ABD2NIB7_9CUCU
MITLKATHIVNSFIKLNNKVNFSTGRNLREKWDIITAVCLERKPIIVPEMNKLEKEFSDYLANLELNNSLKNDFELRNEAEQKQLEILKSGAGDIDGEVTLKQTAQDLIDACREEAAKFKLASCTTADDKTNNIKSLNRKLSKHLVLLTNQKIGNKTYYLLPQGERQEGESLRQAAERILKDQCGDGLQALVYSNAPAGFYKYKYPKSVREKGSTGAKVFHHSVIYIMKINSANLENS